MIEYKRELNSDVEGINLFNVLVNIYNSLDKKRLPFDSKEKFIVYFNNGDDLLVQGAREVIDQQYIMERYFESRLNIIHGNKFEDLFLNSKFSAHTHPPSYEEFHKRPSDGDYYILKNYSGLHYVIDESYIYCINFEYNNGFYGKWNWESGSPIYVSDEHYDIEFMKKKYEKYHQDDEGIVSDLNEIQSVDAGIFEIHRDGTIRIESNI
jgi:hypothetical protein